MEKGIDYAENKLVCRLVKVSGAGFLVEQGYHSVFARFIGKMLTPPLILTRIPCRNAPTVPLFYIETTLLRDPFCPVSIRPGPQF